MSPHTTVLSTQEAINEEDENINNISNDTAQEDNLTEIWNTALTFIILFLLSVVYSICVTFVKVGARGSTAEFREKHLRQATPVSAHSVYYYKIIKFCIKSGLIYHLYTFYTLKVFVYYNQICPLLFTGEMMSLQLQTALY